MDDKFKLVILSATNVGSGRSINPYLKVKLGNAYSKQTKPVKRTSNPKFNETFDIPLERMETHATVEVWDYDLLSQDKFVGHVKIPILNDGEDVTLNMEIEENKGSEALSYITYKFTIERTTKPDDYGSITSTFDDYPYFGTFRIFDTWEISLKDSVLYFYSPSHLYNEKINRDYFTVERVMGIISMQEFIFHLKFQSQFEDIPQSLLNNQNQTTTTTTPSNNPMEKKRKRAMYSLVDAGQDTPHTIRKHWPAMDFVCSYLEEASGIFFTQFTTVIDSGSSGAYVVTYYSNCASRNREVYENFVQQSTFIKTENLPWTDIEIYEGSSLKVPNGFKVGSESGIVFMFSPIQQCYKDVICDNFMIQLLETGASLVKVATSIQNQFREKKQLELVEDLELIDLELGSNLVYGYRFEVKFIEDHSNGGSERNVSQIVILFSGAESGQKYVFTYTSSIGLQCRNLFLKMIESFSL